MEDISVTNKYQVPHCLKRLKERFHGSSSNRGQVKPKTNSDQSNKVRKRL